VREEKVRADSFLPEISVSTGVRLTSPEPIRSSLRCIDNTQLESIQREKYFKLYYYYWEMVALVDKTESSNIDRTATQYWRNPVVRPSVSLSVTLCILTLRVGVRG